MTHTPSQSSAILAYLLAGHTLTTLDALQRFQCMRLASRVNDLRKDGHNVVTTRIKIPSGKFVAEYHIPLPEGQQGMFQ